MTTPTTTCPSCSAAPSFQKRRPTLFLLALLHHSLVTSSTTSKKPQLRRLSDPNTQFCGRTWGDAINDCSPSTHCPNGSDDCGSGETCHEYLPGCNINDMSSSQQESPSGAAPGPTPPPIRNEYDERNNKFCGSTWNDASDKCELKTWCPMGNECDAGLTCWGGVSNCNAFILLEYEGVPGVNNNPPLDNGGGDNGGDDGGGTNHNDVWFEDPQTQCSSEVYQCKSGQFVARAPELNCAFYPCPVEPLVTTNSPTVMLTYMFPTYSPTERIIPPEDVTTNAPTVRTRAPTLNPTVWTDNDPYDNGTTNNNESNVGSDDLTTANLWCGESRFDATRNCGRKGYDCIDGYCLQNLSCFMIGNQCDTGAIIPQPQPDPTPLPTTLSPTTLQPVVEVEVVITQLPSSSPSDNNEPVQTPNLPEMYCARSMDELEASCSTAQECVTRGCPLGHMCYPYQCKGSSSDSATLTPTTEPSTMLTNSPNIATDTTEEIPLPPESSQGSLGWFCASAFEELETTCSTSAETCVYDRQDCPSGQWCYQYYCSTAVALEDGEDLVIENDVAPEENPELSASVEQPPQTSVTSSYCASSIIQLQERCGLAQQCTTNSECVFEGETCMKYDCRQNLMQCPLNFVGWHSSKDCKDYYHCEQGVVSSPDSCGDGMKFDKSRGKCTTDYVDEFCYGLASYEHTSGGSVTQPGIGKERCPPGLTGWHSSDGACKEYQKCTAGIPGPTRVCGLGLKFDTTRGECIDEALVNPALCVGPLPQTNNLCPYGGFIGWGVRNDCTEYFYCENGSADFIRRCADGLLFDMQSGSCKPASTVNCGGKVVNQVPSEDANSGVNVPSAAPSVSAKDLNNSFDWSDTSAPTVQQKDSKIPPWMVFKRDINDAMRTTTLQVGLFTVGSIFWMIL